MAKKKNSTTHVAIENTGESNYRFIFYMLFPLLLLAPYFRGLFFDEELVIAHMFTAIVAGLYFYFKKDQIRFSRSMTDYAGIGMIVAYCLSALVAYEVRDAIGEVFKVFNYFLVYLLISKLSRNTDDLKKILLTFFISGFGVALIGIGSAFGTFSFNGAFQHGLINSTLQYHNAGAIYMAAAGMLGIYLSISMDGLWARILITAVNYVVFMTAFGAGSRGALLIAPVAVFIQFIGLPRTYKLKFFYNLLAIILPFAITAKSVLSFGVNSAAFHWGILFLGFVLTAGIQFGMEKLGQLHFEIKKSYYIWTGIVIVAVLAGLLTFKGTDIMPASIADRAQNINLSDNNVRDRFYFYSDAFKVIKDHPLLGVGGGGWNNIYRQYQSYFYNTTEVHSHIIQTWVEGGLLAFLSFIMLWIGSLISAVKIMRNSKASPQLQALTWSAFATALALGMHSCIDFTLSLGAAMIFLWGMFGIIRSGEKQAGASNNQYFSLTFNAKVRKYFGIAIVSLYFLVSCSFWISDMFTLRAYSASQENDMGKLMSSFEWASTFDPFDSKTLFNLTVVYSQNAYYNNDQSSNAKSLQTAQKLVKRSKGDSENYWLLANAYINNGQMDNAIQAVEKGVAFSPFTPQAYINAANLYNKVAGAYMNSGDIVSAKALAKNVLALPEIMKRKDAELDEKERSLFKGTHLNELPDGMENELKIAQDILARN